MDKISRKAVRQSISAQPSLFVQVVRIELNEEVIPEYMFDDKRKWRIDYVLPAHKIAIEVEGGVWTGGRHVTGAGFMKDMEKYNELAIAGFTLLRTVPSKLTSTAFIDQIRRLIAAKNNNQTVKIKNHG